MVSFARPPSAVACSVQLIPLTFLQSLKAAQLQVWSRIQHPQRLNSALTLEFSNWISIHSLGSLLLLLQTLARLRQDGPDLAKSLLTDNNTIQLLKAADFDFVLRDIFSWPAHLLSHVLDIPEVDVLTFGCLQPFYGPRYSVPNPLAYIPGLTSTAVPPMVIIPFRMSVPE